MLRREWDGPVLRLELNRPQVRNAFNAELIAELGEAFAEGARARVVVLTGAGSDFCAGGDLNWMRAQGERDEESNYHDALHLASLYRTMAAGPFAVVCGVQGAAFGGGCGLVCASDVAVAAEGARFAFSEVRLGLVPATVSPYALGKIGLGFARAFFVTGEAFGTDDALRMGLVQEVVATESLEEAVERRVDAILRAGPEAVAGAKRLAQQPPLSAEDSARLLARVRAGAEAREGLAAFLEKRVPAFAVKLEREE